MLDVGQHAPLAFASAGVVVSSCLAEARFPARVSVADTARLHRKLANAGGYTGPWGEGPYFVAHLDRPMNCLASDSAYREVAVMGPSQVGKSEIGNNWQLHSILYDPTDMLFVMPDRVSIDGYVKTQFDKMIELTPALSAKLIGGAAADTINLKRFRGGDLHFLWPTGPTFRARPIPRGRLDDLDDIPTDIADQGDAPSLMRGRMGSFTLYGRTMLYMNSTPKLGPLGGIEALVAGGTDERFWVDCLMCGAPFALYGERLVYDTEGSARDAGASAAVICEECGGVHTQRDKRALLETYRWVGKGEAAVRRSEHPSGKVGELEAYARASFRLDGLFGFRPWSEIAELGREAEITYETTQDDGALKTFDQTIIGRNYRIRTGGDAQVTEDELQRRAKAAGYALGEVPPGVEVLIAAIDQQGNRFEVAIWGFGQGFRAWLVDRFALRTLDGTDSGRALNPFRRPEDWAVIHPRVMARTYPMAGAPDLQMKIFNTIVDTGGLDNATDNAFAWWHAMVAGDALSGRKPLPATAITLVKGGNNPKARLLPAPSIDAKRQIKGAPQAELYQPNVNRMKDILDVRLNRRDGGPGAIGLPYDVQHAHVAELRAETKQGEQWVRAPHSANETTDLYNYAFTVMLRFGGSDASLAWVPGWARPPKGAPVALAPPLEALPEPEAEAAAPPAPVVRIGRGGPVHNWGQMRRKTVRMTRSN